MTDREKVINGLGQCLIGACKPCSYYNNDASCGCKDKLIEDAIALLKAQENEIEELKQEIEGHKDNLRETLDEMMRYADELKAQEPRLVTESDFDGADEYGYIPVWTEEKDGDMYWECIPKVAITDPDDIGAYRFWTSRPSDEVRMVTPWN